MSKPHRGTTRHPDFIGPRLPEKVARRLNARYRYRRCLSVTETLKQNHPLFIGPRLPDVERKRLTMRRYHANNREVIRERGKKKNIKSRPQKAEYNRRYAAKNRKKISEQKRIYAQKKRETDIEYVLMTLLRGRTASAVKRRTTTKCDKTVALLGCSIGHYFKHIEGLFLPGMTWANRGKKGWHIDHIIPVAAFDLTDPEQQRMCFHYSNQRPIWALDNLSKGDRITPEAIALIVTSQETIETDVLPVYIYRAG